MSLRDLTARSSQARSDVSVEALKIGRDIFRRIADDHDAEELSKLKRLAEASLKMERPVEIKQRTGGAVGIRQKLANAVAMVVNR
jgi:CRP-like cAMP-binding protein